MTKPIYKYSNHRNLNPNVNRYISPPIRNPNYWCHPPHAMVLPIDGQPIVTVHKSIPKHKIYDTIDSVINNLSFTEKAWKFGNLGRNSMTH